MWQKLMENTDERNKKMHGLHLPAATTTIIKILEHMCIVKYKHTHICMYVHNNMHLYGTSYIIRLT